ncbi:MAG: caspase family protein [Bacteroidales bacterium]|nr:caspase family protein [Bacteroidales bacterium]
MLFDINVALAQEKQTEASVNREYQNIIMQYLQKDVNERQANMREKAEEMLLALPRNRKLYDESKIEVNAEMVNDTNEQGGTELNYVITINYNCRNKQGGTDDYGSGKYLLDQSNSSLALCELTQELLMQYNDDLFIKGKDVTIEITGSTDETPIKKKIEYLGEYGDYQYEPTHFNGEDVRVSINDSIDITTNAQLAYIRAQGIRTYLDKIPTLQKTNNSYKFITRCYADTGSTFRRSGIVITLHSPFTDQISYMNDKLIQDEFIEYNIPVRKAGSNANTFAVIIANENYEAPLPNCPYAWRDATVMREYCVKTLGIPERHVRILKNASIEQIQTKGIEWLKDILKAVNGEANLIVYYSGNGISDFNYNPYLIPYGMDLKKVRTWRGKAAVDVTSQLSKHDTKEFLAECLPVDSLCARFNRVLANNVTFIFDAGFNGYQRDGDMLVDLKHTEKKPRGLRLRNDIVIFNAADYNQTAYSYDQQKHGFLTYFMCKELKRTKGNITYGELFENIKQLMSYESSLQGKLQEPTVIGGGKIKESWQMKKFIN